MRILYQSEPVMMRDTAMRAITNTLGSVIGTLGANNTPPRPVADVLGGVSRGRK